MSDDPHARARRRLVFVLLLVSTTLGLAGTDLVLPAVPALPESLGGGPALAQMVLASFVAGAGAGLVLFGELGARFNQRSLLVLSLASYALLSQLAAHAPSLEILVGLRFIQGAAGAAAAVFAPGMIRHLFSERDAVNALGLLGSIEAIIPALAPVAGVWLLQHLGWQGSFHVLAAGSVAACALILMRRNAFPALVSRHGSTSYLPLLRDRVYLRYALSQAFTLGALLTFVFGAPVVITQGLGGTLSDFIVMQVTGIAFFMISANSAGWLSGKLGAERLITGGSALSACGTLGLLAYAFAGGSNPLMLAVLFIPVNMGLGFRGPPGFYRAILASDGNEARGSALVLLAILLTAAGGTAIAAPFVTDGLLPLALVAAAISVLSVLTLALLPGLPDEANSAD
jgi:predicted MFS family arabinose efflux permease